MADAVIETYINTLMIQQILTDQAWWERMKPDDLRALTPLIYAHINPTTLTLGIFSATIESAISASV